MTDGAWISQRGIDMPRLHAAWSAALPHVLFGLRLWASVSLALAVAFWLQLESPYWAAASASVVCQPSLGASMRKGHFRVIGTIAGAVAIVVLMALFPQDRIGLLAGLTLWCAVCGFLAAFLRNFASYGAALAGFTAAIVFGGAVGVQDQTFNISVARATEISIGVLATGLVLTVTDFGNARRRLGRQLGDVARSVAAGLAETLASGLDAPAARSARRELIRRVVALDATIDEAIGEAEGDLRTRSRVLQAAEEGLFAALAAWRRVASHLQALSDEAGTRGDGVLRSAVSALAERDWVQDPEGMRETCRAEAGRIRALPAPDLSDRLLADGVADALSGLERAANGLVLVVRPGRERLDHGVGRLELPDTLPAIVNVLRIFVALIAAEFFWIETDWSSGQLMIEFTAIGTIVFALRADEAYFVAVGFAIGTILATVLAAIVNFAVLPAQRDFVGLALVLAWVLVPIGALSAGTWHKPVFTGAVATFIPLLAPANEQVYDLAHFFNSAFGIVAGTVVVAISLRLIPPVSPAWRTERLLDRTLRDLRRLAGRPRWRDRAAWISLVCNRLAVLPQQAALEDSARLVAALSTGIAVIALRDARPHLAGQGALDRALACLAQADVAGARSSLADFRAAQPEGTVPEALAGLRAQAAATVISEALARHSAFFASAASPAATTRWRDAAGGRPG